MIYLFDTNVVSELRKRGRASMDQNLEAWVQRLTIEALYISVVTLEELEIGVLRLERRDPIQGAALRSWLQSQVLPMFAERILPIDRAVALRSAGLHVPDPRPIRDAFVAATALVYGMTVVTRNVADFGPMNVGLVNPFEA